MLPAAISSAGCRTSITTTDRVEAVRFLNQYSPAIQANAARNPERCYFGNAPTLAAVAQEYGFKTASKFVFAQVANLVRFFGSRMQKQVVDSALRELADVITTEYYFLNAAEILLFFHRFKAGKYGKMYGDFDPLAVTTGLREFVKERAAEHVKRERIMIVKERAAHERRTDTVTYEQYKQIKHRAENGDKEAAEMLKQQPKQTKTDETKTNPYHSN